MKRVVVTGIGITSCLGITQDEVASSLKAGRSGIRFNESYQAHGFRSQVSGSVDIDFEQFIDRKTLRFMGNAAAYAFIAMQQAIEDAGLTPEQVSHPRTGLIAASGGASSENIVESADIMRDKGVKRVGPYRVTRTMGSTVSACLATPFKIKGVNYSITSACATSAHCIGNAVEQIQLGKQDIVFAGGGEEEHWTQTGLFDGMVVVEELEHARARGAKIYAEITGYGATSDGYDMVAPSGEGAARCMRMAMASTDGPIDYINTHGTSTPVGDVAELKALVEVFGDQMPVISSTKSLSGHSLGAAGVQEAIYCLLMMKHNFIAASANVHNLDEAALNLPILTGSAREQTLNRIMSNSFGFGGTNACLVFDRYQG